MELSVVLLVIQIFLTFVLTLSILIIMLRQPSSPNLKLRFENGKKIVECQAGITTTLGFYIENVGNIFAKPAATELTGWVNFPLAFTLISIQDNQGTGNTNVQRSNVYADMNYLAFPYSRNLFYKEKWYLYIAIKPPKDPGVYQIFIPLYHERGNCENKVMEIRVT